MLKKIKIIVLIILIIFNTSICSSCWNYREINDMSLILGLAIDKTKGMYKLTGKMLLASTDQQDGSTLRHIFIDSEGVTIFDAVRNFILKDGKKVYFGHLLYIIISEKIAKDHIDEIMDFFMRDDEVREDMWLFIAPEPYTSQEVLHKGLAHKELASYVKDTTENVNNISKFNPTKLYEFVDCINSTGKDGTIPLITLISAIQDGQSAYIKGCAVFNKARMVGTLTGDEAKALMVITNKEKGGVLPVIYNDNEIISKVSLELSKTKTKITPIYHDDSITLKIKTDTTASIGEIMNTKVKVVDKSGREKLIQAAESTIKANLENIVNKAQKELKSDIFGFGEIIKNTNPDLWKQIEDDWNDIFQDLQVEISSTVKITGSALYREVIDPEALSGEPND